MLDSHGINDLTNVGVPYSTGKIGNALSFDGTAKKVSINGNPFSNSQGSVSCWFKLNSAANLVNYTIFSYGGGVAAIAGNLQLLAGGDGTNFNLSIVQRSNGGGLPDICRTGFIFNPGSWYFIVLSSDSSEWTMNINVVNYPLSVYLGVNNGDWFEDTVVSPITKTVIGAQYINNSYSEYFDGLIDQFLVHDVKLSTTQITKMWNSGNGLDYNNF